MLKIILNLKEEHRPSIEQVLSHPLILRYIDTYFLP